MTREEAAEVLTELKQRLEMSDDYDYCYYSRDIDAYDTALTALREPALDKNGLARCGCWYCEDGVMQVSDSPNKPPVEAKYCGLCGKKLEVEG